MILRVDGDHADHIALGDSFLVLDRADGLPQVITDEREVAIRRLCSQVLDGVAEDAPEYDAKVTLTAELIERYLKARVGEPA